MSTEANVAVVRRFFDEVVSFRNLDAVDDLVSPDLAYHDVMPGLPPGCDGLKALLATFAAGLSRAETTIEEIVAEGDLVTVLHVHRAVQTGPFLGLPPSGREVVVRGIEIYRVRDGRIAALWRHDDDLGLLAQLGIVQLPAPR